MSLIGDVWTLFLILLFMILSCHSSVVVALSCYKCNSFNESECSGGSLDKFKTQCQADAPACRKMFYIFRIDDKEDKRERTVRQCAKTMAKTGCISIFGTNGKRYKQITCECTDDYCNVSFPLRPEMSYLYIMTLVNLVGFV